MAGLDVGTTRQRGRTLWFDTERDPTAYLRYVFSRAGGPRRAVFPFWSLSDPMPFVAGSARLLRGTLDKVRSGRLFNRLRARAR